MWRQGSLGLSNNEYLAVHVYQTMKTLSFAWIKQYKHGPSRMPTMRMWSFTYIKQEGDRSRISSQTMLNNRIVGLHAFQTLPILHVYFEVPGIKQCKCGPSCLSNNCDPSRIPNKENNALRIDQAMTILDVCQTIKTKSFALIKQCRSFTSIKQWK